MGNRKAAGSDSFLRSRGGASGIAMTEVIIASLILVGGITLTMGIMSDMTVRMQGSRQSFQLEREHETIRDMLSTLTLDQVRATSCLPHPYERFNPTTRKCEAKPNPGSHESTIIDPPVHWPHNPSAAQVQKVRDLAISVYNWSNKQLLKDGMIDAGLSESYFISDVKPKMIAANCTSCHDGDHTFPSATTPNLIDGRDLSVYTDVTNASGLVTTSSVTKLPLATKAMFASRLGPKLLLSTLDFENLFARSQRVNHRVSFWVEAAPGGAATTDVPYTRTFTTLPYCPGPCDNTAIDNQVPVLDGEVVGGVAISPACTVSCTATATSSTGGKDGGSATNCTQFLMNWHCKQTTNKTMLWGFFELTSTQTDEKNRTRSVSSRGAVP